jgi:CcmD family protein
MFYVKGKGDAMEYVAIAYVLIFLVVVGYIFNLRQRMQAVQRERDLIESKDQ